VSNLTDLALACCVLTILLTAADRLSSLSGASKSCSAGCKQLSQDINDSPALWERRFFLAVHYLKSRLN